MPDTDDKIMSLSKYIISLPSTTFSVACMVFISFILGSVVSSLEPSANYSLIYSVLYGGAAGIPYIWCNIHHERSHYAANDP